MLKSQPKPEPRIVLPTDALPPPDGPKKRIAAITTAYFKYSHADDIITKFIEGYADRRAASPAALRGREPARSSSSPRRDIGRGMAARYGIPLFDSARGGADARAARELAVDGVLLIGEHGDYPHQREGAAALPAAPALRGDRRGLPPLGAERAGLQRQALLLRLGRRRVDVRPVARAGLPDDGGLERAGRLAAAAAGVPARASRSTAPWRSASAASRPTGSTRSSCSRPSSSGGAAARRAWRPCNAWKAPRPGTRPRRGAGAPTCSPAALRHVPGRQGPGRGVADLRRADPEAVVFLVEYGDGFRAAAYVARGLVAEFAFAAEVAGRAEPVGTWCELNKPQRDHFSFLCNHIEVMFRTGRPSYPVERTYLVTGMLAALMDSHARAAGASRRRTFARSATHRSRNGPRVERRFLTLASRHGVVQVASGSGIGVARSTPHRW